MFLPGRMIIQTYLSFAYQFTALFSAEVSSHPRKHQAITSNMIVFTSISANVNYDTAVPLTSDNQKVLSK